MTPNQPPFLTEVVGGVSGRLGSQFMRLLGDQAVAVPRGVCPGSLSSSHPNTGKSSPIFVCTIASRWLDVVAVTVPERRTDLVFVGNGLWNDPTGILPLRDCTVVIPHYAILRVGDKPIVSDKAPPTYIAGKHAALVQGLLQLDGIHTEILDSEKEVTVRIKATLKLLWTSCLWLMCHAPTSSEPKLSAPLTVARVHEQRAELLNELVHELWPSVDRVIRQTQSGADSVGDTTASSLPCLDDVMQYLQQYSESIPNAIPSLELALSELGDRNGVFARPDQSLHKKLMQQVAGIDALSIFNDIPKATENQNIEVANTLSIVDLRSSIGISFYGRRQLDLDADEEGSHPRKVLIVGAGILGCSVALNLARLSSDIQITVVDRGEQELDTTPSPTTRASWGWLNANQKQPLHYQHLNALGMHAWRCDPVLRDLPQWSGSLVRYEHMLDTASTASLGFYTRAVGPLTRPEWLSLEPHVNFAATHETDTHPVYSFPNEGLVDPCEAVIALRQAAAQMGVMFLWNRYVADIRQNCEAVSMVTVCRGDGQQQDASSPISSSSINLDANMVVVAAGTGSSSLASIPLLHRPGRIAFYKPRQQSTSARLKRVLVDVVGNLHVLQRRDGTIVVGGGSLEVGGTTSADGSNALLDDQNSNSTDCASVPKEGALYVRAALFTPLVMQESLLFETAEAVRPMPVDGLPVLGNILPGLYTVVAHSGITLGPLLGSLAAAEIFHSVELDVLNSFRPQRFKNEEAP